MQAIVSAIGTALGAIMRLCYALVRNYGLAIIVFTLISKIILMPISLWSHRNGLKMVHMQPEINRLHIKYFGDKDAIAEGQAELYKREKYNPLASLIPLAIQIVILMGVIEVIYRPMKYILHLDSACIDAWLAAGSGAAGFDAAASTAQLRLLSLIQHGEGAALAAHVPEAWQSALPVLEGFGTRFLGVDLTWIASEMSIVYFFIPLAAGASSLFLSLMQNHLNPLQREQKSGMQWGTLAFSVGLSLYLGYFVPAGVALYWITGNILAVFVQMLLNALMDPRKHVDYQALEESRGELEQLNGIGKDINPKEARALRKREKADYKRFFSVVNKHLVFYSESNGFYKYFKGYIEYLLEHSNLTIHYITSDPNDSIFELEKREPRIRGYYIGEKRLITLMMKMDADVVCMTMQDLQNFHIKRSYVRDDIEYINIPHGVGSSTMTTRKGSLDHFDTLFMSGPHRKREQEQTEVVYGLPKRRLVEVGYPLIDEMRASYNAMAHQPNDPPKILIAPSWQKDNIVDSCLEQLLDGLKQHNYQIIVRPHPQEVRLKRTYMNTLKQNYEPLGIEIQTDFSKDNPVLEADVLVTDWSDICFEYAYTTLKPVLFINMEMKVRNPEYQMIKEPPLNIVVRDQMGRSLDMDQLDKAADAVDDLLKHREEYRLRIDGLVHEYLYNPDCSAPVGAEYIIQAIQRKIAKKGEHKQ